MNVNIPLQKSTIMTEVYRITGYTGSKTDGEVMDKISSTEDDDGLLEVYYSEASGSLSDIIAAYGSISDGQVYFNLPSNWDDTAKGSLEGNLNSYMVNYICSKWFNLTKKEDVSYYQDAVNVKSVNIIRLLCKRKKPQRT